MNIFGAFPARRMRRMRRDEFSRRLMRETILSAGDLIYPVFVLDGKARIEKVASMPGVERMTVDRLLRVAEQCVKFGIPALLLSRSTRRAGIVVGLLFHLFLGARYPSFSTLAYASYVYFLPPVLVSRWIEAGSRLAIAGIPGKWWFRLGAVGLPLFLLLAYEVGGWRGHRWGWLLVFTILVTAAVVLVMRSRPEDWRRRGAIAPDLWTGRVVPGVLVALLVVQALGPYMGFKTATALAMYSNLRTEQASNHLLIPKGSLQIVDWQHDLVRIRSATSRRRSVRSSRAPVRPWCACRATAPS